MKRKLLYVSKSIFLMLLLFAALPAYSAKIYFKNTLKWENVYVYTYSSAYWNNNGSGSQGIQSGPNPMTLVSGTTDIYEYEVNESFTIVSFTKDSQSGYENFHQTEACYSEDYNASTPLFTPNTTASGTYNSNVNYYNNGTWSAYPTQNVVGVIRWGIGSDWTNPETDATITWNGDNTQGTATIYFSQENTTYEFGLKTSSSSGDWFSNSSATITSSNHDNIAMNNNTGNTGINTKITTTTAGEYKFTITYNNNLPVVSVTYPSTPTPTPTPSGGTYYLVGDNFGGWSTDKGKPFVDGEVTVDFAQTYSETPFKILSADGKWYGSTGTVTSNSNNITLSTSEGNANINIDRTGTYTFKMTENSDGTISLNVTYPTVTKRFYLTGSVTSDNSFSTMNEDFKIDPSKTTTIEIDGNDMGRYSDSGNSAFAIICDDETDWYMRPSTGTNMIMGESYTISSANKSTNFSLYFNSQDKADYKYIFTIKITEGTTSTATVMVQRILKSSKSVYFVSPELTKSARWEAFKMSSSRVRNGGGILQNRLSFNLQDFVLDKKYTNQEYESITYWFEDEDGNKYYPYEGNYEFDDHKSSNDYAGKGTTYATVTANYATATATSSTGTDTPSTKFKLTKGKAKSYTWLLDTSTKKVEYIGNPSYFGNETEAGAYYLVGNFADADAKVDIKPETPEGRKLMNKYWFKDGKAYTKETADADSIVYRVTVPMPAKGWSHLYLAVFSKEDLKNWDGSESGKTASWNKAIRPEEQWDYNNNTGLDGTALHGGLFAMGTKRADQAINPIVSDEYSSYTFSMNVTTSTYKLVFNSNKLYLMGPAVDNSDDNTGWDTKGTDNMKEMTYVQEEQCYKYLENGIEKPMQLYAGKNFAFVYNKDFTNVFYDEDAVVPVDLSGTIDAYATANNDKGNCDTQYVNFIKSATSNKSAYDPENVNACTFNLPSGEYTLRLYIRTDPNNPEKTDIYYLIKDRQYPFYWPDADASKMEGYTTFRSFCDYHAVIIPGGIDVFTVDTPNKTNKTVKLTSYTLEANRVLPANTPVLLAKKDVGTRTLTSYVTMEYYSVPNYTYTSPENTSTNLLHGQVSRNHIPVSNDSDGTLNFLFGYKKLQGDEKVTVGFFTPGAGNCSINTAYLTLSSDFWNEAAQQNTKGFRLVFDDNNETTSVDEIQTVSDNAPAVYYNMQGVRVLNPGKGLYIRNGKKYIIR